MTKIKKNNKTQKPENCDRENGAERVAGQE